ncbi:MFS transporter [Lysinibacillus sphaericus]|uniref:Cyanate transporter n=2 Tax=Lysinibacillus TaxID=400634 RepID=A0A2S0K5V3_LYSSH|nr:MULTISPECIES: MFS transporter [Lysinibacillus]AVK98750.1 MFS transporter [Lysinibacillus sphaericus]MED4544331.1 MFS transporter [Lysinibacillus sphaericus]TKI21313.1 MFS transporter [Lysinibacillus sphaericus]TKI49075.1 MFS transporter [Lysinibacillus tabacifolii]SUV15252.1 cyanate transporter [Lysinibacillus sphaericus]
MTTNEQSTYPSKKINWKGTTLLLVIGVIFLASTLRMPLTVVGPIISFIREDLGISNVLAGFLTTIPLLAFAIVSPFAPVVARKLGLELTLFLSTILLAVGIVLRSLGTTGLLVLGTMIIGVAISFGNVLIPGLLKLKFPYHVGLLMAFFTMSMNLTAGIGAGISYPIANAVLGWQGALAIALALVILTIVIWLPQLKFNKPEPTVVSTKARIPLWKSPVTWAVTGAMGLQSLLFYTTAAWIPEIYIAQGVAADRAGWMFSIMQISQVPMALVVPIIASKMTSQRPLVLMFTAFYVIGFTGVVMEWTSLAVLWMILLGLAGGASFALAMMFFTLRTRTAFEAADLSGFAQSLGYLLAAVGPILFGYLHDLFGGWDIVGWLFVAVTALLFFCSFRASKNEYIN